jgi:hypothetical protein
VEVMGIYGRYGAVETRPALVKVDISRFGEDRYRAPTSAELTEFNAKQVKEKKAKKSKSAPLINPSLEDCERLQALLNSKHDKEDHHGSVKQMTQGTYSLRSKSDVYFTACINNDGRCLTYREDISKNKDSILFKVRVCTNGFFTARSVVHLTDKPTKKIDWDAFELEVESEVSAQ